MSIHTNRLIDSSSPYLLQHAHNPVDWYPWGKEALQKALAEDKPIIVSIGYSACHWCHVMERECFENESLARIMNDLFVCIKVDREERPDIDQIYMDAVQNMGLRGGWPLNVFLTSTAEPFYGGTYFPPQQWHSVLSQISKAYTDNRKEIEESAQGFTRSLNRSYIEKYGLQSNEDGFTVEYLQKAYENLAKNFDPQWGGMNRAPKFPMPSNYSFLLRIGHLAGISHATEHTIFTLNKMALGGIYDQVGGGFARYSTDGEWFLPHFEKMLYDNGQLLSLYADAYRITKDPLFKATVYETIAFVKRELTSPEFGFYSALDADSEGEEGKFYVWKMNELQNLIPTQEFQLFVEYFNVNSEGNWEHGNNILWAKVSPREFAKSKNIDENVFYSILSNWKVVLLYERAKRIRPGLDDKILTSWNGLMLNGLVDAYRTFDEPEFLDLALKNAHFLIEKLKNKQGLYHNYKNGKASIIGFLEDYAFVIQAFTNLYQATFDEKWLFEAEQLTESALKQFIDTEEEFLFFTSKDAEKLIARKKEIFDNVIPASNSQMAINLFVLGTILEKPFYQELAQKMLSKMGDMLVAEPSHLSNWGNLLALNVEPIKEIAISGPDYLDFRTKLDQHFIPSAILVGTNGKSHLPLLQNRDAKENETMIYVCENKTCQLPVNSVENALKMI